MLSQLDALMYSLASTPVDTMCTMLVRTDRPRTLLKNPKTSGDGDSNK